jgi:hypothetical protein
MLKEKEIRNKGLQVFRECIAVVPSLGIGTIETLPGKAEPDYRVTIQGNGLDQAIYIEIKMLGTPKNIREAVNLLTIYRSKEPSIYGVVLAPFISPESAGICKQAGIGYVDLSGNCWIAFQQVFINRDNMPNQFPFKAGLSSLYSPKSERVLRVLLTFPFRAWKTVALAEEADVSLGMITHICKKLDQEEWIQKTAAGFLVSQPEKLLLDWSRNYSLRRNTPFNFYTPKSLADIETELSDVCVGMNIPYALTGFSASNRLAPIVRGQRVMAYVSQDIPAVAKQIGLKSVDSGANVTLIQPYDDGVLWKSQQIDGVQTVTPVQAYLDLKQSSGRGEEAAEFLFKEVIKTAWQQ